MSNVDPLPPAADRKSRILDAAERCFVRNGFHKSTMQDVAAECGMSPGNLYRYFPSKDAIVAGLAERDRDLFNADFVKLLNAPDLSAAFVAIGRRHMVDEPRAKTIMMLEIWAEACRNPRMAEICSGMDLQVMACMTEFITLMRASEGAEGIGTPREVAVLIMAMADGLFRRRATDPSFAPAEAFALMLPIVSRMIGAKLPLPSDAASAAEVP